MQQPAREPALDDAQHLESLDRLRDRTLAGDSRAETELFGQLRVRFLTVAKKRVQPDHVEDVVHEALEVILAKFGSLDRDRSLLLWSLTVLRNVIGNHYQARRRDTAQTVQVDDWRTVPAAALTDDPTARLGDTEAAQRIQNAIDELARRSPRCGAIFARILESIEEADGVREVSQHALTLVQRDFPDLSRNTFYVALHRCRAQLRGLLDRMEAAHG